MHSSSTISIALLALTSLAVALPQPQQSVQTGQAINPINGLPLPGAASDPTAASQAAPTLTALTESSPSPSPSDEDLLLTITPTATLPSPTDATSAITDAASEETPNTDGPSVLIWTDTAANTIYTVTRSTTSFIPVPTMQVPPDQQDAGAGTATVMGPDGKPTPTSDVDTFVQGYTGAADRVESSARVWWLLGAAAAVGAMAL